MTQHKITLYLRQYWPELMFSQEISVSTSTLDAVVRHLWFETIRNGNTLN